MTAREPALATFAIRDRFEIDGPFVARAVEERDLATVATAFQDEDEPIRDLGKRIPALRERGVLFPYVIEDTTAGSIAGGVTLRHFDPMRGVIEVGYWLFPETRGRGLATRAVRAVAFAGGLWRIEANVRIGNQASERVLERAGFTREGIKRRLLRHDGERVDATSFSLLADDA